MRRIAIPLLLGLMLLGVASPVAAAPPDRQAFSASGFFAMANWDSCFTEPSDVCTQVSINAFSGTRSTSFETRPTRTTVTELCYGTNTYDPTGPGEGPFTSTFGCTTDATVTFAADLSTATASGTVPLQTCTFDPQTGTETCEAAGSVDVVATWTAIGPAQSFRHHSKSTSTVDGMTCTNTSSGDGTSRFATASATVDGTALGDAQFVELREGRERFSFSCR